MRVLLDTHAWLWWLAGDASLSKLACSVIADDANVILISAASVWEVSTKHRIGKLPGAAALLADLEGSIAGQGFTSLPIGVAHAQLAGNLPGPHRDPFNRMLIAQSLLESVGLVTNEGIFAGFGTTCLW